MRYLIYSDVHSNLQAFSKMLDLKPALQIDRMISLGDVIGYGAHPRECYLKAVENSDVLLMGNHEAGVCGKYHLFSFTALAREALLWTKSMLGEEECAGIATWEYLYREEEFVCVHGTPDCPEEFHYTYSYNLEELFESFEERLCFLGHSHQAMIIDEEGNIYPGESRSLVSGERYVINVGSVGQPRDNDYRGCFVVFDSKVNAVEFIRFEYDVEAAAEAIINRGLPAILAMRLFEGR